jgi:hypothetical protein
MSIYELPDGYVYERGPIDWWWGWSPVSELKAQPEDVGSTSPYDAEAPWHGHRNMTLEAVVDHALARIRADGRWEGDISQGPYIAGLVPPNADSYAESEVIVGLKQSNNGTVYVWSPRLLAYLDEEDP